MQLSTGGSSSGAFEGQGATNLDECAPRDHLPDEDAAAEAAEAACRQMQINSSRPQGWAEITRMASRW